MKTMHKVAHIFCLPWLVVPILFGLMWVPFVGETAFCASLTIHNCFVHEWNGRLILGISIVALVAGFLTKPLSKLAWLLFIVYAIVLGLLAASTIWWGVTGQQYTWP